MSARELDPRDDWFAEPAMVDDLIDRVRFVNPRPRLSHYDVALWVCLLAGAAVLVALSWIALLAAVAVGKWALLAVWPLPGFLTIACLLPGGLR